MSRDVTCIVEAAGVLAARALAVSMGDGPGSFSVPLSTSPNETDPAVATHWGYSGQIPNDEVDAFEVSVAPMINVTANQGQETFHTTIASRVPQLYMLQEAA